MARERGTYGETTLTDTLCVLAVRAVRGNGTDGEMIRKRATGASEWHVKHQPPSLPGSIHG